MTDREQYTLVGFSSAIDPDEPKEGCPCFGKTIEDIGIGQWKRVPMDRVGCALLYQCCEEIRIWIRSESLGHCIICKSFDWSSFVLPGPISCAIPGTGGRRFVRLDPYYCRNREMLAEHTKVELKRLDVTLDDKEAEEYALPIKSDLRKREGDRTEEVGWPEDKLVGL